MLCYRMLMSVRIFYSVNEQEFDDHYVYKSIKFIVIFYLSLRVYSKALNLKAESSIYD
jgi:hypothetical protein